MKKSKFPPGWDEDRVRRLLAHYDDQTEEEAVAEDEAAFEDETHTVMEVPFSIDVLECPRCKAQMQQIA